MIRKLLLLCSLLCLPLSQARADTPDNPQAVLHVLNRLGYGPRPGDVQMVEALGLQHYIDLQLHPDQIPMPDPLMQQLAALPGYGLSEGELFREYGPPEKETITDDASKEQFKQRQKQLAQAEVAARLLRGLESPRQLQEVMTEFWFNHFNVFEGKGLDRLWVQNFEDTAIRPYAMGRFRDLLGATANHPAMLFYLDNWQSSAPRDPRPGKPKPAGLNENYARELLELHTLGVNGGYTQDDVIALARILTGWTINRKGMRQGDDQAFWFNPRQHDMGDKVFLGEHIQGSGQDEGEHALDVLASSPVTAHHICYQLVQFFVADEPDPRLVDQLVKTWLHSDGDLTAVLTDLFHSNDFRNTRDYGNKLKTPYQFALSAVRAADVPVINLRPIAGFLQQAGQPVYGWQTPDGYKSVADAWVNPDAILRRINFATALGSGHMPLNTIPADDPAPAAASALVAATPSVPVIPLDAGAILQTLGGSISDTTRQIVASSPPFTQAALVLGSPDFMKR